MIKKEVLYFKKDTPCITDYGFGPKQRRVLFPRLRYEVTKLSLKKNRTYTFQLWDDQGYIGTYWVNKVSFENNVIRESHLEEHYGTTEVNTYTDYISAVSHILQNRTKRK